MKNLIRTLAIALAAASLVSCLESDDAILRGETSIAEIQNGRLVTDMGNIYNVTTLNSEKALPSSGRVYILGDVLNKTVGGQDNEYDYSLLSWAEVSVAKALTHDEILSLSHDPGKDPVYVESGWFSGGYANLSIITFEKSESPATHYLDVEIDETRTSSDTLALVIRHNSQGENDLKTSELSSKASLISIPIEKYIDSQKKKIVCAIKYKWRATNLSGLNDCKDYEVTGVAEKASYVQESIR